MTMTVDHFGYVVKDINISIVQFTQIYGYELLCTPIYDPLQHVKLALLRLGLQQVELVQPIDTRSPSYDFMEKGGGLHHICYRVIDIDDAIRTLKSQNHMLFKSPTTAMLFNGKKIAFLYERTHRQIIELVEA